MSEAPPMDFRALIRRPAQQRQSAVSAAHRRSYHDETGSQTRFLDVIQIRAYQFSLSIDLKRRQKQRTEIMG